MQDITVMTDKSDVGIPHVKYNLFDWNIVNNKHVTKKQNNNLSLFNFSDQEDENISCIFKFHKKN